LDFVLTIS